MVTFKSYSERKVWLGFVKAKFSVDEADNLLVEMRSRNAKFARVVIR